MKAKSSQTSFFLAYLLFGVMVFGTIFTPAEHWLKGAGCHLSMMADLMAGSIILIITGFYQSCENPRKNLSRLGLTSAGICLLLATSLLIF